MCLFPTPQAVTQFQISSFTTKACLETCDSWYKNPTELGPVYSPDIRIDNELPRHTIPMYCTNLTLSLRMGIIEGWRHSQSVLVSLERSSVLACHVVGT